MTGRLFNTARPDAARYKPWKHCIKTTMDAINLIFTHFHVKILWKPRCDCAVHAQGKNGPYNLFFPKSRNRNGFKPLIKSWKNNLALLPRSQRNIAWQPQAQARKIWISLLFPPLISLEINFCASQIWATYFIPSKRQNPPTFYVFFDNFFTVKTADHSTIFLPFALLSIERFTGSLKSKKQIIILKRNNFQMVENIIKEIPWFPCFVTCLKTGNYLLKTVKMKGWNIPKAIYWNRGAWNSFKIELSQTRIISNCHMEFTEKNLQ